MFQDFWRSVGCLFCLSTLLTYNIEVTWKTQRLTDCHGFRYWENVLVIWLAVHWNSYHAVAVMFAEECMKSGEDSRRKWMMLSLFQWGHWLWLEMKIASKGDWRQSLRNYICHLWRHQLSLKLASSLWLRLGDVRLDQWGSGVLWCEADKSCSSWRI